MGEETPQYQTILSKDPLAYGLAELIRQQAALNKHRQDAVDGSPDAIRTHAFAMMVEIAELCQLLDWKPWKTPRHREQLDVTAIADEYADVLAFLGNLTLSIMSVTGMSISDLSSQYRSKTARNKQRAEGKEEGYKAATPPVEENQAQLRLGFDPSAVEAMREAMTKMVSGAEAALGRVPPGVDEKTYHLRPWADGPGEGASVSAAAVRRIVEEHGSWQPRPQFIELATPEAPAVADVAREGEGEAGEMLVAAIDRATDYYGNATVANPCAHSWQKLTMPGAFQQVCLSCGARR